MVNYSEIPNNSKTNNMEKETAVSWFVKEIQTRLTNDGEVNYVQLAKEAKAMEKEQIIKALERGFDEGCKFPEDISLNDAEQYYNETYTNGL
jgi:hypothetical protein